MNNPLVVMLDLIQNLSYRQEADPEFCQDNELVKSRTKIIRGQEAKLRFAIKIWI